MSELIISPANNRSKSAAAAGEDADPFRWLEDSASPEPAAWVTAQNRRTQAYLASVPAREAIRSRLTDLWDFARSGVPFERGGRWFAARNPGRQDQLVGACLTQHPELFGAAVADVGVFDMLRFHHFTVGWLWKTDYGDPEDPEQYRWLRRYSPLHNVRPGHYPATLLTTGDHDDRVVPGHSFKFAAALQEAQRAGAPVLLRVETSAGHGHGKPAAKAIAEAADRLAFIERALNGAGSQ